MSVDTFNLLVGLGAIALQILAAAFLAVYFLRSRFPDLRGIGELLARRGLLIGLLAASGAAIFSLVHSYYFGLPPCELCWWQRIFMYPQIVLFAIALWRRDALIALYSMVLSIIGAGIALYHHALQMFPHGALPCPATGPSCSQILFLEFGYITYPMLALSLFAFVFVVMLFVRERA